jgi:2-polyprenyl-3-methyl-5-hydroxy-6-metoxy-1,4-benzoquinol methylase
MTLLVIGPSSSGKSTYILSQSPSPVDVCLGSEIPDSGINKSAAFIHYNLLHGISKSKPNQNMRQELIDEPIFRKILKSRVIHKAVVIVAPIHVMSQRALKRSSIEPELRSKSIISYPSSRTAELLHSVDLYLLYESLFEILEDHAIPFDCLSSGMQAPRERASFTKIDRVFVHKVLRGEIFSSPSELEIADAISMPGMHYQRVRLPGKRFSDVKDYGHVQEGRQKSFEQIFEFQDLRGKSILDIGCALGDFLYRAEQRGASKITGLELDSLRYNAARKITQMLCSRAQIKQLSLEAYTSDQPNIPDADMFDWVLALNVLHHISDIHAFCSQAASLARQFLAIEFPTLQDQLWHLNKPLKKAVMLLSGLPIIGVGNRGYDQRFVFTDAAVKRLVCANDPGLSLIRAVDSPIKHRRICIFARK